MREHTNPHGSPVRRRTTGSAIPGLTWFMMQELARAERLPKDFYTKELNRGGNRNRRGHHACDSCGKTISRNKTQCFKCKQLFEQAGQTDAEFVKSSDCHD